MKSLLIVMVSLACLNQATAQLQLISFAGDSHQSNQHQIAFSLGEVAVQTWETNTGRLTEGLHQPSVMSTSIQEIDLQSFRLFPNPAHSELYLQLDTQEDLSTKWTLLIMDMRGQVISAEKLSIGQVETHSISVRHLKPGMYMLSISNDKKAGQFISRFVKQ